MYTAIHNIDNVAVLQRGLDKLNKWANEWQLNIAINKCSVLYIGNQNPSLSYSRQTFLSRNILETADFGNVHQF